MVLWLGKKIKKKQKSPRMKYLREKYVYSRNSTGCQPRKNWKKKEGKEKRKTHTKRTKK